MGSHKDVSRADAHPPGKVTDFLEFADGTADPSAPASGEVRFYFKSDSPYWINSGGTAVAANAADLSASNVEDLANVGTAAPANNDLLVYSTAGTAWEPNGSAVAYAADGGKEALNTVGTAGTALTVDLADGNVHDITLTAGTATLTFSGATSGVACSFTLIARQDGTGSRTITWPAAVDWSGGAAPTLSTAASAVDVLTFLTVDNGTTWLGFTAGTAMA